MEKIQNRRKSLPRRTAAATVAAVAVVAGVGTAPAGADDVSAEAEAGVEARGVTVIPVLIEDTKMPSAEAGAGAEIEGDVDTHR